MVFKQRNDEKDNNGNGLVDCSDPQCTNSEHCVNDKASSSDSCAAMPQTPASPFGFLGVVCMGLLAGLRLRRRIGKDSD